jgi:hypothetical protein
MKPGNQPTVKQQREARRAEKVAQLQQKLARQRRNRAFGIAGAIAGGVLVVGLIGAIIVTNAVPPTPRDEIAIAGLEEFAGLTAVHIDPTPVDYEAQYDMKPPAGGDHHAAWLNCGVYDQPQQAENAVHSLEHGAVWVTYDPDRVAGSDLDALRAAVPSTYSILSPFPGLDAPVVASAWGAQVALDGHDDERLGSFVDRYWKSPSAPEPGATCSGALDGPGLVG